MAWRLGSAKTWLLPLGICVLAGLVSILVRIGIRPIVWPAAGQDDSQQVELGYWLARGDWLGPWSPLTLVKGIGYPIFLAILKPFGVSSVVASHFVYLLGTAILSLAVYFWFRNRWLATTLFVVLALNPLMFGVEMSRLYLQSFTTSLAILVFGLNVLICYFIAHRSATWQWWVCVVGAVAAWAVALTWLYITRPDVVWVFATCVTMFAVTLFSCATSRQRWLSVGYITCLVIVAVGSIATAQWSIAQINKKHYGVALTDDFYSGEFARANGVLTSIQPTNPSTLILLDRNQLRRAYEVSPTLARVRNDLEGSFSSGYINAACQTAKICDGEAGAWMLWLLRDATVHTYGITGEKDFQSVFGQIANEVGAACDAGKLTCADPSLRPGVPALSKMDLPLVLSHIRTLGILRLDASLGVTSMPDHVPAVSRSTNADVNKRWREVAHVSLKPASQFNRYERVSYEVAVVLSTIYRELGWWLCIPALLGLILGAWAKRLRLIAFFGVAAAAGFMAHTLMLGMFYAATLPAGFLALGYWPASQPYGYVALVVGIWCLGRIAVDLFHRWRRSKSQGNAATAIVTAQMSSDQS